MKPQILSSELSIYSDDYREKAWHLAAILLSIGRPACSAEISAKCSVFRVSPEFVEFLCSIPNSPIFLTGSNLVWPSMAALSAAVQFFANLMPSVEIGVSQARLLTRNEMRTYFRKRKKFGSDLMTSVKKRAVINFINENEPEKSRFIRSCFQVANQQTAHTGSALDAQLFGMSAQTMNSEGFSNIMAVTPATNSNVRLLGHISRNEDDQKSENKIISDSHKCAILEEQPQHYDNGTLSDMPDLHWQGTLALLHKSWAEISALLDDNALEQTNLISKVDEGAPCTEVGHRNPNTLVEAATNYGDFRDNRVDETMVEEFAKWLLQDCGPPERVEQFSLVSWERNTSQPQDTLHQTNLESSKCKTPVMKKTPSNTVVENTPLVSADLESVNEKPLKNSSVKMEYFPPNELQEEQKKISKLIQYSNVDTIDKQQKDQKEQNTTSVKHKSKQVTKNSALIQERCDSVRKSSKDGQDSRSLPQFESYIVEEEEGSGGYGTVYRARRKNDGITFAIKCPHGNAHKHHVKNELKMLERFGGRNFVIKYEGSFKNGGSDCFVLEHVVHDRPEVLKREIDISQLQWYGYCMFRALSSLHKQGVFHRDVKPGNFLYSCKTYKGYLIDFNLAKDLYQKQESIELQMKAVSPNKRQKILGGKSSGTFNTGVATRTNLESKNLKRKTLDKLKAYDDIGRRNSITSQGADASGLTSAKDIPSAERLREPLPCQGRKELIHLAQEAMQNPNLGAASTPASNRKRVAASPASIDRKLVYLSPMPLHSSSIPISGAGSLKNRGEVKTHKEGPCAGTKGFRAPEILLRSLHQGPKVDVWSAGVTLLYLITGKMPFSGEPEQNMKDIVRLRGNEGLWEVAKLHNRESSLPVDLLDVRYLSSMKIQDWCVANTKRPDYLQAIPASLFDLIEKCLTVNPRLRITAEEALRHEFFSPCHEALQRQKLVRRAQTVPDSRSSSLSLVSTAKPVKLSS